MKLKQKWARIILYVLLAFFVCIVVFQLFANIALKAGIETVASKTLNVDVSIGKVGLSILGGKISFKNLVVNNPPDYKHDNMLEIGKARVAVNIGSLLTDTVEIKEIVFDEVHVTLEQKGVTSNNIQDIVKAFPKGQPEAEPEPEPEVGETKKASKNLLIKHLELTNIVVKAKLLPIPGKADTVTIKLDPIIMNDLGSDSKMDVAMLMLCRYNKVHF